MDPKKTISIRLAILLGIFVLISFSTPAADPGSKPENGVTMKDVRDKVAAAGRSIEDYTLEQRDEAVARTREELNELDRNIDMLEKEIGRQWGQLSAETRQKWQDTLTQLRKKRLEAAEWYGGVKRGSADAWEEIKKGYGEAYSELDRAWEKAKKEFGKDDNNGDRTI